jgi:multidrug resistance efflux pump
MLGKQSPERAGVVRHRTHYLQDNVEQAEAELNTARANLEYAQNNYARMLEAVKSDAVSQIQVLQSNRMLPLRKQQSAMPKLH